jgi:hypothetical protein
VPSFSVDVARAWVARYRCVAGEADVGADVTAVDRAEDGVQQAGEAGIGVVRCVPIPVAISPFV